MLAGTAEDKYEYGNLAGTTGTQTSYYDLCLLIPATTDFLTVTHGYLYGLTGTASNGLYMAVFENSGGAIGTQVGGCSDEGIITTGGAAWNQVTWSGNFPALQPDTQYWICQYTDAGMTYYYTQTDWTNKYDLGSPGTCPDKPASAGTWAYGITVSNYEAH